MFGFGRTDTAVVGPHAARELQADGAAVLDVREPHEFAGGHVADALHIPLGELGHRMEELPSDRRIVVVCASGNRSAMAVGHLTRAGFDAVNLDGGMMAWQRAGLPMRTRRG